LWVELKVALMVV
jgi:hypothetical protein